jgi:DNA repair protein RecO (recombination protein O)
LVLRTYALGEADRLVVFLTRDRGKKRGVAKSARRPRSRFTGALEPLTEARVAYFESARRELVGLNYAETIRSPLGLTSGLGTSRGRRPGGLTHAAYFAELLNEWAQEADADERLVPPGRVDARCARAGAPAEPLARYFEYWLLRLQGCIRTEGLAVGGAQAFLTAARTVRPVRRRYGGGGRTGDSGTRTRASGAHLDALGEDVEVRPRARDLRRHA